MVSYSSCIATCEKGGHWQMALHLLSRGEVAGNVKRRVVALKSAWFAREDDVWMCVCPVFWVFLCFSHFGSRVAVGLSNGLP